MNEMLLELVEQPEAPEAPANPSVGYQTVGRCGFCLRHIETDQGDPCEAKTRHVEDGSRYCGRRTA